MPSRKTSPPRTVPLHDVTWLIGYPQQKVPGVFLVWINNYSGSCILILEIQSCKIRVCRKLGGIKDQARFCLIGKTVCLYFLYQLYYLVDMFCGRTQDIGSDNIQFIHAIQKL